MTIRVVESGVESGSQAERGIGPDHASKGLIDEKGMQMFSKVRAIALAVVAAGALTFTAAQSSAFAATASTAKPSHTASTAQTAAAGQVTAPITQTFTDAAGQALTFTGQFTPSSFTGTRSTLTTAGTVTGTITNALGQQVGQVSQAVTTTATPADPTCNILSLNLGPLDLNLLGVLVHLNQVVLTITAQSGAGNLLGNLLCAVANLLNNSGSGNMIPVANLLNQILSLL